MEPEHPQGTIWRLILTHGGLARELLTVAEKITGDMSEFETLELDWEDSLETARVKMAEVLGRLRGERGILVLTDMYGSTSYNVAAGFRVPGHVEVVTGVNLPMIVRLGCPCNKDFSLEELAVWIQGKGRQSICRPGDGDPNGRSEASGLTTSEPGES